jgi:hypothetical protein
MDETSDGALSSGQLMHLYDQLEHPANGWTTVRSAITLDSRLSESEIRNLLTFVCGKYDAVHSRVVRDGHVFRQAVTSLEYFFATCVRFTTSPDPDVAAELESIQLDVLTCSSMFVAVLGGDTTTLHHLAHHAFFDRAAVDILLTDIVLASRDAEIVSSRAQDVPATIRGLQPWQVKPLELLGPAARATKRWQEFHAVRREVPWPPVDLARPPMTYTCVFGLGRDFARACADAARRWSISLTGAVNSAVGAYLAVEFGGPEITVKAISSNRFRRELTGAVACVSGEVWTAHGTQGAGKPEWCRAFAAAELTAHRYGFYDWDAVRRSPNFRSPYRSDQTIMINTFSDVGPRASSAPDALIPDVLSLSPAYVPHSLTHDLQIHITLTGSEVGFSLSSGHDRFDDPALADFSRGLKKFLVSHFG